MKKRNTNRKWLFLALSIPVVYIVVQLFMILQDSYVTAPVIQATMPDTVLCNGILGMQQTEILYDGTGVICYEVADGERVTQGMRVADVFTTLNEVQDNAHIKQQNAEIAVLEKMVASQTGTDVEMLLTQSYTDLYALLQTFEMGNYEHLTQQRQDMQLVLGKMDLHATQKTDYASRIAELVAKRDASTVHVPQQTIVAPTSGYFASGENSEKQLHTPEMLVAYTPTELQDAIAHPAPQQEATVAGAIIHNYKWDFFTVVDLADATKFENLNNRKIYLSFIAVSEEELPVTVVNVEKDEENNVAKIQLRCDYINADVVSHQNAVVQIRFKSYEGLRVDKRALRIVDEVNGVYVKQGNVVYFKPITILFENEEYFLVSDTYVAGENEVRLYDEVIVQGKNLSHGKIVS